MNTCPHCDTMNAPHRRYCQNCGRRIVNFCSHCGFSNELSARFCGGCGHALDKKLTPHHTDVNMEKEEIVTVTTDGLSSQEVSELEKINRRRRETLDIAGTRKTLHQEDLDELFGGEKK